MIEFGLSEEGYEQYRQACEAGAIVFETPACVVEKILSEGSADYYGDEGEGFFFDKYDLERVHL